MDTPPDFLCPITCEVMTDPVVAADGHSYERDAIIKWFGQNMVEGNGLKSPLTNEILTSAHLVPNTTLKKMIGWWVESHQVEFDAPVTEVFHLTEENQQLAEENQQLTEKNQQLTNRHLDLAEENQQLTNRHLAEKYHLLDENNELKEQIVELSMEKNHLEENLSMILTTEEHELRMNQLLMEKKKLKEEVVEQGFIEDDVYYHFDEGKGKGKGRKGAGWNVWIKFKGKGFGAKGKGADTPYYEKSRYIN